MSAYYDYDGQDRCVLKTVTQSGVSTATRTLWDGADEFIEIGGTTTFLRMILQGPGVDDRVAVIDASGAPTYLHRDRLGSTVATSNASGQASETFAYSPYGESKTGTPTTGTPWRYTGRHFDAETGLYSYRARYYAPRLGQFLQTDPIGKADDPNLYQYVLWDPNNLSDPSGQRVFLSTREVTPASLILTPFGLVYIPAQYHMFLVTHAQHVGDPNAQIYSWGPTPGANGFSTGAVPKQLVQQFAGTALNDADRRVWQGGEVKKPGRTVEIDADDDIAAAAARNIQGGRDYDAIPGNGAISNSGAYAGARDADRASGRRSSDAPTPKPSVGTPGWDEAPRVTRCVTTGSHIARSC